MTESFFEHYYARLKGFLRKNWGAPFIVEFMLLLLIAAYYSSLSSSVNRASAVAEAAVVYAYYSLVIGVVLQLVCFWKYHRKGEFYARLLGYNRENWGAPFFVGFILFLVVAAVSLSAGWSSLANTVSVYAFYALVAGGFLQLACFLKYRGKSDGDEAAV